MMMTYRILATVIRVKIADNIGLRAIMARRMSTNSIQAIPDANTPKLFQFH